MHKKISLLVAGLIAGLALVIGNPAWAGVPLNNLEGVGGVAFNPLAYPAGQNADTNNTWYSKPQFGVWYVALPDVRVDWTTIGVAETLGGRLELSYGYEVIAPPAGNIHKNNIGAKLLVIKENTGDTAWVPAISVGGIWKNTQNVLAGANSSGGDFYAVATKLVPQAPVPILLSVGVLATDGYATGVFGYDPNYRATGFANIDIIPISSLALGLEYKQGANFDTFKNADYWNAHAAWFASKNLTLVAAFVNAGNADSTSAVGLGNGLVLSAQYAF